MGKHIKYECFTSIISSVKYASYIRLYVCFLTNTARYIEEHYSPNTALRRALFAESTIRRDKAQTFKKQRSFINKKKYITTHRYSEKFCSRHIKLRNFHKS